MMLELISGKKYYGKFGTGWVVLVNGHPTHFTGLTAKAEAKAFMAARAPHPMENFDFFKDTKEEREARRALWDKLITQGADPNDLLELIKDLRENAITHYIFDHSEDN